MHGTIVRIKADRGFGFVRPTDDRGDGDHFFHVSSLVDLVFEERLVNQAVEFDSTLGGKGLVATNIRRGN